jgi:hypothetical protein
MATSPNATQITPPRVPLIDERTGAVSREWYRWFYSLYNVVGGGVGIIPVASGGTGLSTIPTNGQLLIGNGTGYSLDTLGTGVGISVTNGLGTITLANTGVLSNIAGTGISVSGATGNVTIANTGVLSFSGGTTGLTPSAATTGVVTLAGTLGIANGGTNGSAAPTAYGVAYGTGTAYAFTAAGTTKQALLANTGAAPTWSTLTTGASILYGDGSGGFSNVTIGTGISFVAGTLSATGSGGTVTSVTGTSPVVSSGGTTPAISLATAYGDTLNPYAAKTANFVLAAPNGSAGVPTFRALVAADVPGSALTKTDDTNVTLTLGGSPTTALLNAASLTLGWTGQLATTRGGTGLSSYTANGIVYASSTSALATGSALTFDGTNFATTGSINGGTTNVANRYVNILGADSSTSGNVFGIFSLLTTTSASGSGSKFGIQAFAQALTGYAGTGAQIGGNFGATQSNASVNTGTLIGTRGTVSTVGAGTISSVVSLQTSMTLNSASTIPTVIGLQVNAITAPTSGTTTAYGVQVGSITNSTATYGFWSNIASGATQYNFYASGTAQNAFSGDVLIFGAGGLGYTTGSGGTVTQGTSRTTGVTLNKTNGAITLFSAAGLATFQSFTVTNSTVAATDVVHVTQKSGTDLYQIFVTATAAGSFRITFATTGGVTIEQPVFNFAVIKGVTA